MYAWEKWNLKNIDPGRYSKVLRIAVNSVFLWEYKVHTIRRLWQDTTTLRDLNKICSYMLNSLFPVGMTVPSCYFYNSRRKSGSGSSHAREFGHSHHIRIGQAKEMQ